MSAPIELIRDATWRDAAAWFVKRRQRVRVEGASMLPTLAPGDEVLASTSVKVTRGAVVVARDPRQPSRLLVKRVDELDPDGRAWLLGDNPPCSTDSRDFGHVPKHLLVGVVVARLPRR